MKMEHCTGIAEVYVFKSFSAIQRYDTVSFIHFQISAGQFQRGNYQSDSSDTLMSLLFTTKFSSTRQFKNHLELLPTFVDESPDRPTSFPGTFPTTPPGQGKLSGNEFEQQSVSVEELSANHELPRGNLMFLASRANILVLRTSNFQGATIRAIVPRHNHSIVFIVQH